MHRVDYLYTQTNDLKLRPYQEQDAEFLHVINSNTDIQYLWAPGADNLKLAKFKQKLQRRIDFRWDHYVVIERRKDARILGFAYCYNTVTDSAVSNLCVCMDKPFMNSLISLRAAYLFISQLFIDHSYRKLYAEVFHYNSQCRHLLEKIGFEQEGCLKQHQLWNNEYWDLHILALTVQNYESICRSNLALVNKLSCKAQRN